MKHKDFEAIEAEWTRRFFLTSPIPGQEKEDDLYFINTATGKTRKKHIAIRTNSYGGYSETRDSYVWLGNLDNIGRIINIRKKVAAQIEENHNRWNTWIDSFEKLPTSVQGWRTYYPKDGRYRQLSALNIGINSDGVKYVSIGSGREVKRKSGVLFNQKKFNVYYYNQERSMMLYDRMKFINLVLSEAIKRKAKKEKLKRPSEYSPVTICVNADGERYMFSWKNEWTDLQLVAEPKDIECINV